MASGRGAVQVSSVAGLVPFGGAPAPATRVRLAATPVGVPTCQGATVTVRPISTRLLVAIATLAVSDVEAKTVAS